MDTSNRLRYIMSEWLKAISELVQSEAEKVPKGWKTMTQIEVELNGSGSTAWRTVKKLRQKGLVDTQTFKIKTPDGHIKSTPHYKLKK